MIALANPTHRQVCFESTCLPYLDHLTSQRHSSIFSFPWSKHPSHTGSQTLHHCLLVGAPQRLTLGQCSNI